MQNLKFNHVLSCILRKYLKVGCVQLVNAILPASIPIKSFKSCAIPQMVPT